MMRRLFGFFKPAAVYDKTLYVLLLLMFLSIFLVIYLHYSSRKLTEQNLQLAKKLELQRESWEALLLEKSTLTKRSRLENLAEHFHMALPKAEQIMIHHTDQNPYQDALHHESSRILPSKVKP